jgi:ubiquinone/menaquinone biosynthesis C-methylase UbiE
MQMNERRFHGEVERLRSPERLALLETERVVDTCLEGIPVRNVLEIGTGSGIFAEAFVARGLDVTGIDVNPHMVEVAQRFVPTGHFQVAAAEALPYPENTFDLIFLGHILHEVDDAYKTLSEARRVACLSVAVLEWPYRQEEVGPPFAHRINPDEMSELARQAGFPQCKEIMLTHMVLYRLMLSPKEGMKGQNC